MQPRPVDCESIFNIEIRLAHNELDFVQRDIQFTVEQDLLQLQQAVLVVVAVAVATDLGWWEQADLIVVAQGAGCNTGQSSYLVN